MSRKMYKQKLQKRNKSYGFTIIEVIIVLAIVGLIMTIVFISVGEASVARRDSQRKAYANQVLEAMLEFYKNNGAIPGCGTSFGCTGGGQDGADRFLAHYLPDMTDPLTGTQYHTTSIVDANDSNGNADAIDDNGKVTTIFYWNNMSSHTVIPGPGQLYIANAHWCFTSKPDGFSSNGPIAGTATDNNPRNFAIVFYLEHGGYGCVDNYAPAD